MPRRCLVSFTWEVNYDKWNSAIGVQTKTPGTILKWVMSSRTLRGSYVLRVREDLNVIYTFLTFMLSLSLSFEIFATCLLCLIEILALYWLPYFIDFWTSLTTFIKSIPLFSINLLEERISNSITSTQGVRLHKRAEILAVPTSWHSLCFIKPWKALHGAIQGRGWANNCRSRMFTDP